MFQVRIHGRGGQGAVTAAELLSVAAFLEDRHAQAFPSFGSERTGAPVMTFCRIDDRPIRLREPVTRPDALVIQDATLLHQVNVFEGLRPGGSVLINSPRGAERSPLPRWPGSPVSASPTATMPSCGAVRARRWASRRTPRRPATAGPSTSGSSTRRARTRTTAWNRRSTRPCSRGRWHRSGGHRRAARTSPPGSTRREPSGAS
ncbi:2-oxoacid:acceptor oxidoreductase family protein [Streptomyces sp. NBC_00828]|uniref:2-oxoacid:acceptor oxidoreductase family protein n=1 Tax=Streptomyces sp. NBC_00828 TaxID=2903678 RepID=UPI003870B753